MSEVTSAAKVRAKGEVYGRVYAAVYAETKDATTADREASNAVYQFDKQVRYT